MEPAYEIGQGVRMAEQGSNHHFAVGLARAFAGALIFSISMLMTMEMWWIGFYMAPLRLGLFTLVTLLLLVRLAYDQGFEKNITWRASVIDAFVGYAVGTVVAAVILPLLGLITPGMSWNEIMGKIAIQAIPGAIGALLARSQLGQSSDDDEDEEEEPPEEAQRYATELFTMVVGALFIAFNVAPTEEMILISYKMTPWLGIVVVLLSLVIMHVFVYQVGFRGQKTQPQGMGFWTLFLRFSVTGYALVLLVCLYLLWTFGRLNATSLPAATMMVIVLAFPGALGAATARLIL